MDGSSTLVPLDADFGQTGNVYYQQQYEATMEDLAYSSGYQQQITGSPTRPKRSGGRRSSVSSNFNINPTGIITYMSVEEARSKGLLVETMDESQLDFSYILDGQGLDESTSFLEKTEGYQAENESLDEDDGDLFELDAEQFLRNMCFNPFASFDPRSAYKVKQTPTRRARAVIPIRKSSAVGTKKSPPGGAGDLSNQFVCDLCSEAFKKKLFLNNHMETRHGIKFVFTEKGKKVKLVRMPTQVVEGEKLDPCVRLLMDSNGNNAGNFIGVQPVETVGEMNAQSRRNPTAHEIDPYDILQGKISGAVDKDFGSALLMESIRTFAMKKVKERGETPFVAFRPFRSRKLYLLSVTNFSKNIQLLMTATEEDLENSDGTIKSVESDPNDEEPEQSVPSNPAVGTEPMEVENDQSALHTTKVIRSGSKFSHVAIVLYIEQVRDESRQLVFNFSSIPITSPVHLMKPDYFARAVIQSKPKRLRCLSMPAQVRTPSTAVDPVTVPKRKYTRRSFGRRRAFAHELDLTPVKQINTEQGKRKMTEEDSVDMAVPVAKKKKLTGDEDTESSDDEEADATYVPYRSGGGLGSGKRGRPRKPRSLM